MQYNALGMHSTDDISNVVKMQLLISTEMAELITYYVISALLFVGAPAIFFIIAFMPALQNTKGRMVGYKDHKQYGDISLYEVKR